MENVSVTNIVPSMFRSVARCHMSRHRNASIVTIVPTLFPRHCYGCKNPHRYQPFEMWVIKVLVQRVRVYTAVVSATYKLL